MCCVCVCVCSSVSVVCHIHYVTRYIELCCHGDLNHSLQATRRDKTQTLPASGRVSTALDSRRMSDSAIQVSKQQHYMYVSLSYLNLGQDQYICTSPI